MILTKYDNTWKISFFLSVSLFTNEQIDVFDWMRYSDSDKIYISVMSDDNKSTSYERLGKKNAQRHTNNRSEALTEFESHSKH